MKKMITIFLIAVLTLPLMFLDAYASRYKPRPKHREPVVAKKIVIRRRHRAEGWCVTHPQECHRIKTDLEKCWDFNNDGFLDDYERAQHRKRPHRCP